MTFLRTSLLISAVPALLFASLFVACGDNPSSTGGTGGTSNAGGNDATGGNAGTGGTGGAGTASGGNGGTGGAGGSGTASGGSGGSGGISGAIVEPSDPGAGDVVFDIRADTEQHSISALIYGVNQPDDLGGSQKGAGMVRMGGNRLTAYNWENNASNAGTDYLNQSDDYLMTGLPNSDKPGEAVRARAQAAFDKGAAFLATVPIAGYVAADKNGGGDVNQTPNYLTTRFHPTIAKKNGAFSTMPDLNDKAVYQDEYVAFLKQAFPAAFGGSQATMLFSLDNEPDLWSSTHPRIHPNPVGYAELVAKNKDFAAAIKDVAPNALVAGFVSYGYNGYITLQDAPDKNGNFIEYYLDAMKQAEGQAGKRLVDVLDLHWYSEVYANGQRITGDDTSAASAAAREQAPRSLWDPTYKENSWIANDVVGGPIALVPWVQSKIDAHYPGTGIGFTEYWYGGGDHISGAIAQADVLGIFGREGVKLASLWQLSDKRNMIHAALRAYTSYDGNGAHFGDTSVHGSTSDVERATVYASVDKANPSRMVVVAINKANTSLKAAMKLAAYGNYTTAAVYRIEAGSPNINKAASINTAATNAFLYDMPAQSVSVIVPQ